MLHTALRVHYEVLPMRLIRRSALRVILSITLQILRFTALGQRGEQRAQTTVRVSWGIVITAMEAILMRQSQRGLGLPRIIMAVTHCLAAVCGRMLRLMDGHLPSSGVGAVPLIRGRLGPLNLLQAVLSAERERVLVVVRLVTEQHETTPQEDHISTEK